MGYIAFKRLLEQEEYKMNHSAPTKKDAPLYDITLNDIYPDDFYSSQGYSYYGDGYHYDRETWSLVKSLKDKPNSIVTIYCAVPKPKGNKEVETRIKQYKKILSYYVDDRLGFLALTSKEKGEIKELYYDISDMITAKYPEDTFTGTNYSKLGVLVKEYIETEMDKLKGQIAQKYTINAGDWVGITRKYVIDHGESHLDGEYDIVSKKVKASQVFTDGNSFREWGYDPS